MLLVAADVGHFRLLWIQAKYPKQDVIRQGVDLLLQRQLADGDWDQESICGMAFCCTPSIHAHTHTHSYAYTHAHIRTHAHPFILLHCAWLALQVSSTRTA